MKETIAAAATPPGVGALGILRLSGEGALKTALAFIDADSLEPRRATLARALIEGEALDETVVTYFPGPRSATGEDVVEISCHGSPYILRRLLEAVAANGARLARPGEFTQRAYLNGRLDLAQAEAVCDLIASRTAQAHRAAMSQLDGGLSRAVFELRKPILELLVRIEANLDHPEEDLPAMAPIDFSAAADAASKSIDALANTFDRGRIVRQGARVAIVGRPNAGKSSLLNALLGRDRAIVSPQPGTTRDTIEEEANLEGFTSVLIDTAGLREEACGPVESVGMERTQRALKECDLAVLVIDGSRLKDHEDERVHQRILSEAAREGRPVVSVLNKADLPSLYRDEHAMPVSALAGQGLAELSHLITETLSKENGDSPVLITSLRHRQALGTASGELSKAQEAVRDFPGRWEDRAAFHLRAGLRALDEITGAAAPDEVLAEIFSKFCVGK
jgi:tRNA modification GTPase